MANCSHIITAQARLAHHTLTTPGLTFSVPPQEDFTYPSGTTMSWTANDLALSEIGVNEGDNKAYIRIGDNINEISFGGTGGGSVYLGGSQVGFTNGMVQYINQSSLQGGDTLFTRNSSTQETFILAGTASILTGFAGNLTGSNIRYSDTSIGLDTTMTTTSTLARTRYRDTVNNILGKVELNASGNSITWDSDTTDNIQETIEQSDNIGGAGIKGSAMSHIDSSTGEVVYIVTGDSSAIGQRPFQASVEYFNGSDIVSGLKVNDLGSSISYSDGIANIRASVTSLTSSNVISWDADTTDDIVATITQGDNLSGSGVKGTSIFYGDNVTTERAEIIVGDTTSAGGEPLEISMRTDDGLGNQITYVSLSNNNGVDIGVEDLVVGFTGSYVNLTLQGNSIIWDADTSDTIETKFEQSQDILGMGSLSGSAVIWKDSSTQVTGLVGAVDGSAAGLFPGSVLIVTTNDSTGASSTLATSYDTVNSQATLIASVGNGTGDTGFEFDATRGLIRLRDPATGVESAFEVSPNNAITRYTFDGVNEYQAVLGSASFTLKNSTNGNEYMSIDLTSGVYEVGDLDGSGNNTKFIINDTTGIISANVATGGDFEVNNSSNNVIFTAVDGFFVKMGDCDNVSNGTSITVDDSSQSIKFGYSGAGSDYTFPIGDGTSNQVLTTDGAGQLYWGTASGGGITGGGTAGQVAFFDGSGNITSSDRFTWDQANLFFQVGDIGALVNGTVFEVNDVSYRILAYAQNTMFKMDGLTNEVTLESYYNRLVVGPSGSIAMGDLDYNNNGTKILFDDENQTVLIHTNEFRAGATANGVFLSVDDAGSVIWANTKGGVFGTGDIDGDFNATQLVVVDSSQSIQFANNGHTYMSTTGGAKLLDVDGTLLTTKIGDVEDLFDSTLFTVSSDLSEITSKVYGTFNVNDTAGNQLMSLNTTSGVSYIGDISGAFDNTLLIVDATAGGISMTNRLSTGLQYETPTVGATVSSDGKPDLVINPAGTLLTLNVVFPTSPSNGQQLTISSTQPITTLTLSGGTILGTLTTIVANGYASWVYSSGAAAWVRKG